MRRAFELHDRLSLPVQYKEVRLDCEYRIDILVENPLIVELKRVEEMRGIYEAPLWKQFSHGVVSTA